MKLALGTAQFGSDYGVTNERGRVAPDEVARILETARDAGVRVVDTAPAYGASEEVLGAAGVEGFDVVTKIAAGTSPDHLAESFLHSLDRLRLPRVHALIAHSADELLGPDGAAMWAAMERLREEGLAGRVGASVYTREQIDRLLERYELGMVQLPVNVFDQRLIETGRLRMLRDAGAEVHARSVFLQGMLLQAGGWPAYFEPWEARLRAFREWAEERDLTPLEVALGFALGLDDVDAVVVGVTGVDEFREVLGAARPLQRADLAAFAVDDEGLVDPTKWGVG